MHRGPAGIKSLNADSDWINAGSDWPTQCFRHAKTATRSDRKKEGGGMIGIVGPEDSVSQVLNLASSMGVQNRLSALIYSDPEDALSLVQQASDGYTIFLFTGRIPYALTRAGRPSAVRLDYIPHDALDLMRVLARMLIDYAPSGKVARISLDSVEEDVANQVVEDLGGAPTQVHTIPFVLKSDGASFSVEEVALKHVRMLESDLAETALTCIQSVFHWLQSRHYPVIRVTHAQAVIRASLEKSLLVDQLARASRAETAVILLSPTKSAARPTTDLFMDLVRETALSSGAEIVHTSDGESKLITTRSGVEKWLHDYQRSSKLFEGEFAQKIRAGVGLGESVALAEQNSRAALDFSHRNSQLFMVTADGESLSFGPNAMTYQSNEVRTELLNFSTAVGLSPVSLQGLVHALRLIDASALTANQLAASYNVSARTARRYLSALISVGLAELVGKKVASKAGRPQQMYRVDVDHLAQILDGRSRSSISGVR